MSKKYIRSYTFREQILGQNKFNIQWYNRDEFIHENSVYYSIKLNFFNLFKLKGKPINGIIEDGSFLKRVENGKEICVKVFDTRCNVNQEIYINNLEGSPLVERGERVWGDETSHFTKPNPDYKFPQCNCNWWIDIRK